MRALHILIKILSICGALAVVAGAVIFALITNTNRLEYVPYPIVCICVGVVMEIVAAILRSVANRRPVVRRTRNKGNVAESGGSAYDNPFGDYPDSKHVQHIDPFGFDAPPKYSPETEKAKERVRERSNDSSQTFVPPVAPPASPSFGAQPTDGAGEQKSGSSDKFCSHCGAKRVSTDKFCPFCGHKYE